MAVTPAQKAKIQELEEQIKLLKSHAKYFQKVYREGYKNRIRADQQISKLTRQIQGLRNGNKNSR